MIALLAGILWPPPVGVERAIADVAAEMRCLPSGQHDEVPSVERCECCQRPMPPGVGICAECEMRLGVPEVFA